MRVCRTVCSETQGEKDHAMSNFKVKDKKTYFKVYISYCYVEINR